MPLPTPDLVVIGHVCRDVAPEQPGWRPGGTVYYAASAADRLGYSVGVLTAGASEVDVLRKLRHTTVVSLAVRQSTSFENLYVAGGRRQYLRALAPRIPGDALPAEWRHAPAVLLGPVAGEVPAAMARQFPHSLVGVSPQGYMRRWDTEGQIHYQPWERAAEVLDHVAAAIFSEEDMAGHGGAWLGHTGPVLVMTRGSLGCDVIQNGKRRTVPGFPADEVDPTGAGDVFAAAFMLKLREAKEPLAAARFANAVAAFSVQGQGTETLPELQQVLALLKREEGDR